MILKVKYVGIIKTILSGRKEEVVEIFKNDTVEDLVYKLAEKHGEMFRHHCIEKSWGGIGSNVYISVDGVPIKNSDSKLLRLQGKKEVILTTIIERMAAC